MSSVIICVCFSSQLYNKYPNWPMQLNLNATKPPDFTFSPALGGNLTVFGDMAAEVISPSNKSMQLAFTLGLVSPPQHRLVYVGW